MKFLEKIIHGPKQTSLFARIYESGMKPWIIVTHGVGEHSGRHLYMGDLLSHQFNICLYDLRGHGKSGGKSAYIENFSQYYDDLHAVIQYLQETYQAENYLLFGHSMGALITCGFLKNFPQDIPNPMMAYVNAPPVGLPGFLGKMVEKIPNQILGKIAQGLPGLRLKGMVDMNYLSHDPRVILNYRVDKLNHMALHSKLLLEIAHASRQVFDGPINPPCPAICSYGTEDRIINVQAIEDYFGDVEMNFNLKSFEGAFHEIHNEIERYRKPYFDFLTNSMTPFS